MSKIIGLTGGIGSGKTTVANYFREYGVPVYIADDASRKVMGLPEIIGQVRSTFGEAVIEDDQVNRAKLAQIVFGDKQKLATLNGIIHPAVKTDFHQWLESYRHEPIVIKEAAILFESGSNADCDAVITVVAPLETRVQRVMQRDGVTREQVLKRIENQWDDAQRIAGSDFVIQNTDPFETRTQIIEILKKLKNI